MIQLPYPQSQQMHRYNLYRLRFLALKNRLNFDSVDRVACVFADANDVKLIIPFVVFHRYILQYHHLEFDLPEKIPAHLVVALTCVQLNLLITFAHPDTVSSLEHPPHHLAKFVDSVHVIATLEKKASNQYNARCQQVYCHLIHAHPLILASEVRRLTNPQEFYFVALVRVSTNRYFSFCLVVVHALAHILSLISKKNLSCGTHSINSIPHSHCVKRLSHTPQDVDIPVQFSLPYEHVTWLHHQLITVIEIQDAAFLLRHEPFHLTKV